MGLAEELITSKIKANAVKREGEAIKDTFKLSLSQKGLLTPETEKVISSLPSSLGSDLGTTIKAIFESQATAQTDSTLNALQQPGGLEEIQKKMPGGGSITQSGRTATIPPSPEVQRQKATLEAEASAKQTESTKLAALNTAKKDLRKELEGFFMIDDMIPRTEGGFLERTIQGIKNVGSGLDQKTPQGFAIATHDGARKRLRVKLVRAAGDVGNMAVIEQMAAEQIIPNKFDADGTAKLKRAFLTEAGKAIETIDDEGELQNEIKTILNKFANSDAFSGPKGKDADSFKKKYKLNEIIEIGGKKYKAINVDNPFDPVLDELK